MPRIEKDVTSERVFCLECGEFMFHIINWFPKQRLVIFKKDEFKGFFNGGEVISFTKEHTGCAQTIEGEEEILNFMKKTLPFEEYAEFEKWLIEQL